MKVLEWLETEDKFLAVVQPRELFIEGFFFESNRYEYEAIISGILRKEKVRDIYAHAFDKRWCSLAEAQRIMERMRDYIAENEAREAVESVEAQVPAYC
jgi:hypothetical protein